MEEADRGTLFLDEIGDLNLIMQTKLLRLLQEGEYKPVGSSKTMTADIRFIAATNQDLTEKVRKKEFREDLFYRLNVIQIILPPLRDRKGRHSHPGPAFPGEIQQTQPKGHQRNSPRGHGSASMTRDWPGNIRELENVIERGVILIRTDILQVSDLFPDDQPNSFPFTTPGRSFFIPFQRGQGTYDQ